MKHREFLRNDFETKETRLLRAIRLGDLKMVKFLIDLGADVNARGPNGNTPLHEAVDCGHVEERIDIVQKIIAAGATIDICNDYGVTPLFHAAHIGNVKFVQLLIDSGADWTLKNKYDETPLHYAVIYDNLEIVRLLVDLGIDIDAISVDGLTAFDVALFHDAVQGPYAVVDYLHGLGAKYTNTPFP